MRRVIGEAMQLRRLRQIDIDLFREAMIDWPVVKAGRMTTAVARIDVDKWVQIHDDGNGHAWVAELLDGTDVGVVMVRITDRVMTDFMVSIHPSARGAGHFRTLHALLGALYYGQGIVDRGEWSILPTAAAVQWYAQKNGWMHVEERTGDTGLTLLRVSADLPTFGAAALADPALRQAVRVEQ